MTATTRMETAVDPVVLLRIGSNVVEILGIFLNAKKFLVPFAGTRLLSLKNNAIMGARQDVKPVSSKNRGNATRLLNPPRSAIPISNFPNVETASTILTTSNSVTMGTFNIVMDAPVYVKLKPDGSVPLMLNVTISRIPLLHKF